jgi:hypothetical protein
MNSKPATFNPYSVDLFAKSLDHINKEMNRRGLPYHSYDSQTEKVARIIWKDAYDAGVNDARRGLVEDSISKPKPTTEPETQDYLLANDYHDEKYRISLTAEQKALWDWLNKHNFIDSETYLEKWGEDVIEVGRIK